MKLFALFGCFKDKFNSAIVEEGEMIPTNLIATIVAANQNAMVGLDKNNQERVHTKQIILQYFKSFAESKKKFKKSTFETFDSFSH